MSIHNHEHHEDSRIKSREAALHEIEILTPRLLAEFFTADELISSEIVLPADGPLNQEILLDVKTSAGDEQQFFLWQPDVESLTTATGIESYLAGQLEDWFPTSLTGWGTQRTLPISPYRSQPGPQ